MDKMKYRQAFDSVTAPDAAAEKVIAKIAPRRRINVRRTVLALCLALVLVCGAALASGRAGEWLEAIISLNGYMIPENNIQKVGRTSEGEGLRMTLDSVVSDGVHTYFLMNIEALEGQDLSNTDPDTIPMEDSIYVECELSTNSPSGYGLRVLRIDDGSDPSSAQLVLNFDFGVAQNGERVFLTIEKIGRGIWTTGENGKRLYTHEPIAEGEWTFSVRLNRNLDGVHYRIDGYDLDISISPLGMAIDGVGSSRFSTDEGYLLMENGSQLPLIDRGLSRRQRNGQTYHEQVEYSFTELIDADRAVGLIVNGYEYRLIR